MSSDPAALEDQYGLPAGLSTEDGMRLAVQTHHRERKNKSSCNNVAVGMFVGRQKPPLLSLPTSLTCT